MANTHRIREHIRRAGRKKQMSVRVTSSDGYLQVWLCGSDRPQLLTGTVKADLACDAGRYGQDLVGELVDRALKEADRRSNALSELTGR